MFSCFGISSVEVLVWHESEKQVFKSHYRVERINSSMALIRAYWKLDRRNSEPISHPLFISDARWRCYEACPIKTCSDSLAFYTKTGNCTSSQSISGVVRSRNWFIRWKRSSPGTKESILAKTSPQEWLICTAEILFTGISIHIIVSSDR